MKPTIYTIAEKAGVSIATVSRALNDSPRVSKATRAKVLSIMQEMGYQPSASARGLVLNRTGNLGIVLPQISGPFFSELIRGAESTARQNHYHLLVCNNEDISGEDPLIQLLPARTDGLVLAGDCVSKEFIYSLHERNFPFVLLGGPVEGLQINNIRPDNEAGAYLLTRHLIEVHHYHRIAFINGPVEHAHGGERLRGFCRALAESGLPLLSEWTLTGDFNEAGGYSAMQCLLDLPFRPQAVFASNDQMAIGAVASASQYGVRVPDDIAITGFDDIPTARYLQPALTTVNQSIYEQGVLVVEQLLRCLSSPETTAVEIILPTALIVRQSCGCP